MGAVRLRVQFREQAVLRLAEAAGLTLNLLG